jgi:hypothetical protein
MSESSGLSAKNAVMRARSRTKCAIREAGFSFPFRSTLLL